MCHALVAQLVDLAGGSGAGASGAGGAGGNGEGESKALQEYVRSHADDVKLRFPHTRMHLEVVGCSVCRRSVCLRLLGHCIRALRLALL